VRKAQTRVPLIRGGKGHFLGAYAYGFRWGEAPRNCSSPSFGLLKFELICCVELCNVCNTRKSDMCLLGADIPNKVKIHVWRLARNGLAVGDELQ
jgi:hypothetical protein